MNTAIALTTDPIQLAMDQIADEVSILAAKYPEIGLSFGRAGSASDWAITTCRRYADGAMAGRPVTYYLGATEDLPWCASQMTAESLDRFVRSALNGA